jgi:AraC family transcriptional regulator, transcriptional activator of pobA
MISENTNNYNPDSFLQFRVINLNTAPLNYEYEITMDEWYSFVFITNGNAVLQIDFEEHIALKNKLFFIEKNKNWSWSNKNELEGVIVQFTDAFYNLIYTGNPKIKSDQSLIGDFPPFIKLENNDKVEWEEVIDIILKENAFPGANSREIICLSLKILILMYHRNTSSKSNLIISDRKKQLLFEFRKLVNNEFSNLKTPKKFAGKLHITPNYLNALCKEIYFKTVCEVIRDRVILESKRLLAHSGLSVTEISYKLGFSSNSYFGKYFKKAVGLPPERYRALNYNSLNV